MNNNKRFMVFVVALVFGFGLSTVLKSAEDELLDKVYVEFVRRQKRNCKIKDKSNIESEPVKNAVKNITWRILNKKWAPWLDREEINILGTANVLTNNQADVKTFLRIILKSIKAESHLTPATVATYATKARRGRGLRLSSEASVSPASAAAAASAHPSCSIAAPPRPSSPIEVSRSSSVGSSSVGHASMASALQPSFAAAAASVHTSGASSSSAQTRGSTY